MRVYISKRDKGIVELGKILKISSNKVGTFIVTGDYNSEVTIMLCKDEEEAKKVLNEIVQRVVQPTAKEIEKGIVYIEIGE